MKWKGVVLYTYVLHIYESVPHHPCAPLLYIVRSPPHFAMVRAAKMFAGFVPRQCEHYKHFFWPIFFDSIILLLSQRPPCVYSSKFLNETRFVSPISQSSIKLIYGRGFKFYSHWKLIFMILKYFFIGFVKNPRCNFSCCCSIYMLRKNFLYKLPKMAILNEIGPLVNMVQHWCRHF